MQDNEIKHQPSCEDELNIGLLTVTEAQARILDAVSAVTGSETVPVREALNRILAQDVTSPINLSLIHISEPTRPTRASRMPSSA